MQGLEEIKRLSLEDMKRLDEQLEREFHRMERNIHDVENKLRLVEKHNVFSIFSIFFSKICFNYII